MGSAASSLSYKVGPKLGDFGGTKDKYSLHEGTDKRDNSKVTVHHVDLSGGGPIAKEISERNIENLKKLKHPSILKFLDSACDAKEAYFVTEYAIPLSAWIADPKNENLLASSVSLGLVQIASALQFLHEMSKVHANLSVDSIFVTKGGDWKLCGFGGCLEYPHSQGFLHTSSTAPEIPSDRDRLQLGDGPVWALDSWGLGCVLAAVFCDGEVPASGPSQAKSRIPKSFQSLFVGLIATDPKRRISMKRVLMSKRWASDRFVAVSQSLEGLALMDDAQKKSFFETLPQDLEKCPKPALKYKILPALCQASSMGLGPNVLPSLSAISPLLEVEEFEAMVAPCIVAMFCSNDRATRFQLLKHMPSFLPYLPDKTLNKIFADVCSGFTDTSRVLREATLKSMLNFAPRLNKNNISKLFKYFSRLMVDPEVGLRTNAVICLGKISKWLDPSKRSEWLSKICGRALLDPFPHCRLAACETLASTLQFFHPRILAKQLLPAIAAHTLDSSQPVRKASFAFLDRAVLALKEEARKMDDVDLKAAVEEKQLKQTSATPPTAFSGQPDAGRKENDVPQIKRAPPPPVRVEKERDSDGWESGFEDDWNDFEETDGQMQGQKTPPPPVLDAKKTDSQSQWGWDGAEDVDADAWGEEESSVVPPKKTGGLKLAAPSKTVSSSVVVSPKKTGGLKLAAPSKAGAVKESKSHFKEEPPAQKMVVPKEVPQTKRPIAPPPPPTDDDWDF